VRVVLVGEDAAGIQTLRAVVQTGHQIVAVMASPSRRGRLGRSLWETAVELGYKTWPAEMVKDPRLAERVRTEDVDILLNVYSLFVICSDVLNAPRFGGFNLHPGPLPSYAGLNSMLWAIYRGEQTYGVTLHKMVPKIDAGPIVYQAAVTVDQDDTGLSLSSKCVKAGVSLIVRLLNTAAADPQMIPLVPQDLAKREYFGSDTPAMGKLSWSLPARQVVDFVRACDFFPFPSPWGHPRARLGGREISIVKARYTHTLCDAAPGSVGALVDSGIQVACADEWVIVRKVLTGGRCVAAVDLLKPGDHLEDGR
jgi:methionyl-tRNA formyltransferase